MNQSLITIIIPTHHSLPFIEKCLQSIKNQTYPNIEIIVVDDILYGFEEQQTCKKIIEQYARYIQDGPERSIKQNRGIYEAKGEFVIIVYQDMYLTPNVIESCYDKINQEDLIGVIIPEISIGEGFWTKCVALDRYVSNVLEDSLNEACRFFRKSDVLKIGGYDATIVGTEDSDLHYRLSALGAIGKIKAVIYHDEGQTKFWQRIKKKYYYSKAFREYFRRRPFIAIAQFFPIKIAYIKHFTILLKHPLVTIGMFMLRGCEVIAGTMGLMFKHD